MAKKSKKTKKIKKIKKTPKAKSRPTKKSAKKSSRKSAPARHEMIANPTKKVFHAKEVSEKPLSASEVQKFRDILTLKRDELLAVVQRKKEQELQPGEMEIGDEADIATRSVEREMLFELTDTEKQTVDTIEAALRKMEKGVFGQCESCHTTIPRLRLEVMPWARYCIRCQTENEIPSAPGE